MRSLFSLVALVLLIFGAVVLGRALILVPSADTPPTVSALAAPDPATVRARAERLAGAIRVPTISHQDPGLFDPKAFAELHAYLEATFPLTHATLRRERVADHSLLFHWAGRDTELPPYLLMAHLDVVPVIPGTESQWQHPPYGGVIADDFIWGRGTLDDKLAVVAILDAIEALLGAGFQPERGLYLAFGHDEELGGVAGAAAIAQLLADRGVALEYVMDEGGAILTDMLPGLEQKVALVGIAEKGFLSLELTVEASGGHSSMPPPSTAIGRLSRAVARLEDNPFPLDTRHLETTFQDYLAPHMTFEMHLLAGNIWLFSPLLTTNPQFNAMVRTTTAVTMFNAGIKENVLPINATAVVNHRIIPGETISSVTDRVIEIVDDETITVTQLTARDPSPVSDIESASFAMLARSIRRLVGGEVIVAPYLLVGGTDSKHFTGLTRNVYRFSPFQAEPDMMRRFHGTNERIATDSYSGVVSFYEQLIRNSDQM